MPTTRQSASGQPGRKQIFIIILLLVLGVVAGALILRSGPAKKEAAEGHGHSEEASKGEDDGHGHGKGAVGKGDDGHGHGAAEGGGHEGEAPKGPNGGQRFTEGDFGLELKLSEEGGQPRFKAWLYDKDKAVPPTGTEVSITLKRPGGEQQEIKLKPEGGFLTSAQAVAEPHVFEATVAVVTPNEPFLFTFEQQEGKVNMSDAQIKAASITLDSSGPATIRSALQFPGEIRFNEDRTAHIVPRVAGVVESVSANLGEQVKKGQVLAVISSSAVSETRAELQGAQRRRELAQTTYEREKTLWEQKISPEQDVLQARQALREAEIAVANATQKLLTLGATPSSTSLGRFELRAPFDGMVVEKHIALGEAVKEDANVFTVSDLSTVWAEMSVAARDLQQVRVGERAVVRAGAFDASANGTISYVGSLIGEQTRTARARVVLANPQGAWRPGLFVNVEVLANEVNSPVTVASSALQTVDDKPVVFLRVAGGFVPQPVQVGRSDGKRIEILSGLKPGSSVAAAGSFIVKSEQGKGSATHTH
ncbi:MULTISPECIES: efflux RND transporter periplasmic adaptor subunit [unclassified Variovorax]|uniref:efflux RND transporter periplasmic adaptor subunit n=1 Tax=unclassified Variovorax TaxID=663243 RepID=UPI00076D3E73|nr:MULTISPECIES: efflux RND transporter periplasmic adaptor subunit [unclassified Variovorax]KWT97324.1 Cobalt/zinc/cadmium efflux RND transporter, membrane fusion protein, CzcB family [Variovorax sp. WDL1]PNG48941.1 Cobalt-zinc-cadmium resistance protein CzcB [Variovorax sp. B4]PNG49789.1 Cobalt-zinc-cadmium resistance protein CzcB [Variovorax sp. B2]PNG50636.1 Cobalt-zinc-cadmium resistance protein CzcB [Variovorax sp. B2]PNG50661.1 Cobalt-zinc-cadmium resistance protein CzcB [Variovorax sp.